MGLLNLALGQLLGIFLPLAGVLVALYFYDRSRRRVTVSTLRFWPRRPAPPVRQRHKKIQQPFSLLLQLIAMLLLLLAIADPRPDGGGTSARHHVLIVDTSAAMAMPDEQGTALIDDARAKALSYLNALPAGDRVSLVEAAGAPGVRVPFTDDRDRLREALLAATPEYTALDLSAAFDLAAGTMRLALDASDAELENREDVGEVAYIGAGRVDADIVSTRGLPRVRLIETAAPSDSLGVSRMQAVPDPIEPSKWDITVEVDNFDVAAKTARLEFLFNESQLGYRTLRVDPESSGELRFRIRTERPGRLSARLRDTDAFEPNNQVSIELPATRQAVVEVVGGSQRVFEPLLTAGATVEVRYLANVAEASPDAVQVFARAGEASSNRVIYFVADRSDAPLAVAREVRAQRVSTWASDHAVARGVRDPDLRPSRAVVFEVSPSDAVIASVEAGPIIIARNDGDRRSVVFGFDPNDESVRTHLAVPLLFANAVAWLDTDAFQSGLIEARPPGAVAFDVGDFARESIAVAGPEETEVPWILTNGSARFYAGSQGSYQIATPDQRATLHLDLPQIAHTKWEAPESVLRGVPLSSRLDASGVVLWPWLAALAALLLALDWAWYGRGGGDAVFAAAAQPASSLGLPIEPTASVEEPELEEVSR